MISRTFTRLFSTLAFAGAVSASCAEAPAWINALRPLSMGVVARVQPTEQGDVVVFAGGRDQGFRPGMSCTVRRGENAVADVVVVETRDGVAAALILSSQEAPRSGDLVKIKTL